MNDNTAQDAPKTFKEKLIAAVGGTLVIAVFAGGFWLMGGTAGDTCEEDTDCRVGMFSCVSGKCRAHCDTDADCGDGEICRETVAVSKVTSSASEGEKVCAPGTR